MTRRDVFSRSVDGSGGRVGEATRPDDGHARDAAAAPWAPTFEFGSAARARGRPVASRGRGDGRLVKNPSHARIPGWDAPARRRANLTWNLLK